MAPQLRVYAPDDENDTLAPEPSVHIRLGDLLPLVAMAERQHFIWLKDFLDDEVLINEDLHEVLMAFRAAVRPSA
ncbi:hypothetical protein [Tuwongella immobilis]|uniref:Uncharacterized protein n=1 Tax=Tuwongella immobilis TaxID=692036 RepID=A0A6C2YQU2_9BACT|nr:hypothetical protein [Tuwongella immobilis]VIP03529.1 Uncharacterized protein OS=Singulisphaera acidiphila (strain ATCC BAA-1392 / DSM 18658 / VKM B-2454 / MOB10) GN=Sinac_5096 PE=4 SV=1 [Tuwongella immobilis]VTS04426.1 Uncharacterized protein OS=Singulisphaera acidiphila (strain ATCC BAA-1392 / DSM 18658 / VKM B-2454 / MOB10) GN=Sinac_5096 PE=4 SV=1 [Tuwongella immobilis]